MVTSCMAGYVIEEAYHRELLVHIVVNNHQILFSNEFNDVGAKLLP